MCYKKCNFPINPPVRCPYHHVYKGGTVPFKNKYFTYTLHTHSFRCLGSRLGTNKDESLCIYALCSDEAHTGKRHFRGFETSVLRSQKITTTIEVSALVPFIWPRRFYPNTTYMEVKVLSWP